ncbi:YggS family pyridoxal phosphate-dependent enzyme [Amylibacter sp.]|nr:YggS family pyridoxal phosphate-dependent enzyme [Amylibacter sp.]MDA9779858.1 YggS family pyridoxal phosphate-dependent enzyme [Amylibacter sp.]MDB9814586.1 YggS family pyridoxal phosphate-dependent enzyme [Amylibacter sp.]MDC1455602.1 YggS family pyridoxal phosphate-dependent enzyme [Amylibacter sp.]
MQINNIKNRIQEAEKAAQRINGNTNLIAVSKKQPNERIEKVLEQGHKLFGENKVQEAHGKWPMFRENFSNVKLHLIGPLQSNKVKQAVELFDAIHTLDRLKLAQKLSNEIQTQGKAPEIFIQINTGEEKQKSGIHPNEADQFISDCISLDLPIKGLMVIPPINEEPSLHFGLLRKIAHRNGLTGLSMGMSSDFESAIAMGATHIRVGSAIFGERNYS